MTVQLDIGFMAGQTYFFCRQSRSDPSNSCKGTSLEKITAPDLCCFGQRSVTSLLPFLNPRMLFKSLPFIMHADAVTPSCLYWAPLYWLVTWFLCWVTVRKQFWYMLDTFGPHSSLMLKFLLDDVENIYSSFNIYINYFLACETLQCNDGCTPSLDCLWH